MKFIKREEENGTIIDSYRFSDMYKERVGFSVDCLLLYELIHHEDVVYQSLAIKKNDKTISDINMCNFEKYKDTLKSLQGFLNMHDTHRWYLEITYHGFALTIKGRTDSDKLYAEFRDQNTEIEALMFELEERSYRHHSYDKYIVKTLMARYRLSEKNVVLSLMEIQKHSDIWRDFFDGFTEHHLYDFSYGEPVRVNGFTAERLQKEYDLSEMEAYVYLGRMREDPDATMVKLNDRHGKNDAED